MVGEDDPVYLEFWARLTVGAKMPDFQSIFAHGASAVTHSEKKFN